MRVPVTIPVHTTLIVNSGLEWLLELSLQTVNWNGYWNSHCKQWTGMVTGTLIVNSGLEWLLELSLQTVNWNGYWCLQ